MFEGFASILEKGLFTHRIVEITPPDAIIVWTKARMSGEPETLAHIDLAELIVIGEADL